MSETAKEYNLVCTLCGEQMPEGETMFKFHGYSGPCPAPPLPKLTSAETIQLLLIEFADVRDGRISNIPYLAVKIAEQIENSK